MNNDIKKIIEVSVNAPSGDNSQPWKFRINDNKVTVFLIPGIDDSIYNYKERGSFISIGALLENIVISASQFGYKVEVKNGADVQTVELLFTKQEDIQKDFLFSAIPTRVTNRRVYKPNSLSVSNKDLLSSLEKPNVVKKFLILDDQEKIRRLGSQLCFNEKLMLVNKNVHDKLFSSIRWTKEEEEKYKSGLYVKTLELALPQEKVFKLFRNWKLLNFLNKFSVWKLVTNDTKKLYSTTPAYGLIVACDYEPQSLVSVGRFFQRIWLTAEKNNMAIQPVGALIYLAQRAREENNGLFTLQETQQLLKTEELIREIFNITDGSLVMLFRLGFAERPSAHSLKKPPEYI